MFEYLFKAKLKNEQCWVVGDLVRIKDGSTVKTYIYGKGEVDPKTICQYTGQIARGVKIFNNDICRFYDDEGSQSEYIVLWDNKNCRYIVKWTDSDNSIDDLDEFFAEHCEVIGNIYDVSELV